MPKRYLLKVFQELGEGVEGEWYKGEFMYDIFDILYEPV
jgi:hypothetical protein